MKLLSLPLLAFLLATAASAQITSNITVGPNPAPVGADISFTVSHDEPLGFIGVESCAYRILKPGGELVFDPGCGGAIISVGPFGWVTRTWNQEDQSGTQVPAGTYVLEVSYDFKPKTYSEFIIDASAETGIVFEGTATTGDTFGGDDRNFYLVAPGEGGYNYWLIGSLNSTVGFPTCGGNLPLDFDFLFSKSAIPNKIFKKSFGVLSPAGATRNPEFPIPNDPTLIGVELYTAFMVVDVADPVCIVRKISPPLKLTII